jgi:hypothetical protein
MYGAETCRSGINILNILVTLHMHFVEFNSFHLYHHFPSLPTYNWGHHINKNGQVIPTAPRRIFGQTKGSYNLDIKAHVIGPPILTPTNKIRDNNRTAIFVTICTRQVTNEPEII